jgi:hypothetical protein
MDRHSDIEKALIEALWAQLESTMPTPDSFEEIWMLQDMISFYESK